VLRVGGPRLKVIMRATALADLAGRVWLLVSVAYFMIDTSATGAPMDLKKRTFEDLIGNLADDAKKALDEILERESTPKSWTPAGSPGVTPAVGTPSGAVGPAAAAVGGLATTVSDLNETVGGLATLPEQIAKLSELMEKLLPVVQSLTEALGTAGNVAGAAGKANPSSRS
jgi:hypothetical protein